MLYCLDQPYPKIKVDKPNIEEALLILNSYAGEISENTASHLYLYQSFSLKEKNPKYSGILEKSFAHAISLRLPGILEKISIVEMKHLELLAHAIQLLGLAPAYVAIKDNKLIPWNSSYVNYELNVEELLKFNIESEKKAIRQYEKLIDQLRNVSIQNLIKRIIQDEEIHITIFSSMLKEIEASEN